MLRPRPHTALALSLVIAPLLAACGGGGGSGTGGGTTTSSSSTSSGTGGLGDVDDIMSSLPESCAFDCGGCDEATTPFACPPLLPWEQLPHDDACGAWDGKYPAVTPGQCTASAPANEAVLPAGPLPGGGGLVLPDGHRIRPAGRDFVFAETDLKGGFPVSIAPLPGTHFALVSDSGIHDDALRLIDVDALANGGEPVASYVPFPQPSSLFWGIAWLPPNRALVSGGGDGMLYAFDVDTTAGTIARAASRDIQVGMGDDGNPYFIGPLAVTPDGQRIITGPSEHASDARVFSLGASDYGMQLGSIPLGSRTVFDLQHDPDDAGGTLFYATDQGGKQLLEIDLSKKAVSRTVALGKNPEQIVFLDATYAAITEADSDSVAIVDRSAAMVAADVPIFAANAPHGSSPSAIAYGAAAHHLYATLAGVNAVEVFDVTAGTPPTVTPSGRISTAWWPTGVMTASDGSLVVISGKGHGTGTDDKQYTWGQGTITDRMHGSLQHVPTSVLADLANQTTVVDQNHDLTKLAGASAVTCPNGADDFPIPADNTHGPSKAIKHVILVVRENKTYDGVFGDRSDLGNGDPALIMASDPTLQGKIWQNARSIAQAFTNFDNFYTDAEQSIQGHTWTVYGRTTDYMERTWLDIWGRATRGVAAPTTPVDGPQEGGIFSWMSDNQVSVVNMGEIVGGFGLDTKYPGLIYAQGRPDVDKSCYMAGRIRLRCDLPSFTYAVQSNDHTYGGAAGQPAPEVMIAVNDEASGLLLDALSHSPIWKESLLIITEDDPQDGGDHVDLHRSLLLMASPWVKRAYVSHGHYDMASVYKLVGHIFGVPYHNDMIENAMVPFDVFTSTPDYTPYTYTPRKVDAPCNAAATQEAKEAERWDFTDLDDQPGLSAQITRMMKQTPVRRGVKVLP